MRHQTHKRIELAWRNMPAKHDFKNREQFYEIAASLGEVDGDGKDWHYCSQHAGELLGPNNLKLVLVDHPSDWDRVLHPAI